MSNDNDNASPEKYPGFFSPFISIAGAVCGVVSLTASLVLIVVLKKEQPLHGYETALYPMIVSAYTALLGFVIAASTIILSITAQPPKIKGSKMIAASANGAIQLVFESFISAKHALLVGILVGSVGLFLDRPSLVVWARVLLYTIEGGTCLLVLWEVYQVISVLKVFGRGLLSSAKLTDLKILEANPGKTTDQELDIPEGL